MHVLPLKAHLCLTLCITKRGEPPAVPKPVRLGAYFIMQRQQLQLQLFLLSYMVRRTPHNI